MESPRDARMRARRTSRAEDTQPPPSGDPPTFGDLPDNVLEQVFDLVAYLGDDDPTPLAGVCRRWRRVHNTSSRMWGAITLSPRREQLVSGELLINVLRSYAARAAATRVLCLGTDGGFVLCSMASALLSSAVWDNLRVLIFEGTDLAKRADTPETSLMYAPLMAAVTKLRGLQELSFSVSPIGQEGASLPPTPLPPLGRDHLLSLTALTALTKLALGLPLGALPAEVLPPLRHLRKLRLLDPTGAASLPGGSLAGLRHLRKLHLHGVALRPGLTEAAAAALTALTFLELRLPAEAGWELDPLWAALPRLPLVFCDCGLLPSPGADRLARQQHMEDLCAPTLPRGLLEGSIAFLHSSLPIAALPDLCPGAPPALQRLVLGLPLSPPPAVPRSWAASGLPCLAFEGDRQGPDMAPPDPGAFTSLQSLYLTCCDLQHVPPCVVAMTSLLQVGLRDNLLSADNIPGGPWLRRLEWLDLADNVMGALPPTLAEATALRHLDLSGNDRIDMSGADLEGVCGGMPWLHTLAFNNFDTVKATAAGALLQLARRRPGIQITFCE